MTFEEFLTKVKETFPLAQVGTDNDYQLIVYTGLTHDPDKDEVVQLEVEE